MTTTTTTTKKLQQALLCRATIQCRCGQTKIAIDSSNVLRIVCYCKDCRGYYNTLNQLADTTQYKTPATLDAWGGCDYIHIMNPSDIKVIEGKKNLLVGKIRKESKINRVYTSCCYTPIYSIGNSKTCLVNATLMIDNELEPLPIRYRIMGRHALVGKGDGRPMMSWSVPLSWFWTMFQRIPKQNNNKNNMITPIDVPNEIHVLENFQQG
jgi:hypothetical protein